MVMPCFGIYSVNRSPYFRCIFHSRFFFAFIIITTTITTSSTLYTQLTVVHTCTNFYTNSHTMSHPSTTNATSHTTPKHPSLLINLNPARPPPQPYKPFPWRAGLGVLGLVATLAVTTVVMDYKGKGRIAMKRENLLGELEGGVGR